MTSNPSTASQSTLKSWATKRRLVIFSILLVLILGGYIVSKRYRGGPATDGQASSNSRADRSQGRPQPVSVGEVTTRDVHLWLSAIGSVTARNMVTVHSRVDGELLRLNFIEGQTVKKGQLLAEIDPRTFQAQLAQVNGQLARDTALLHNAQLDLKRYQELWASDSIAKQQVDTQEALVRQYQGTVENDKGLVDNAKLQLSFTQIIAPVSGRIGLRQVDPGNQIHASDATGLASIAQIEPITVVFSVPENQLPEINRRLAKGEVLTTDAWDSDKKTRLASGRLLTADNQIDQSTGTIKLKAEFANTDHALFPNQFVNVRLLLGIQKDATVIPSAAINRGARGTFVYALDGDDSVKSASVTLGAVDGDVVAIEGPLKAGDKVVVDGADKLRDGAKIQVIHPDSAKAGAGTGGPEKHRGNREGKPPGGWEKGEQRNQGQPAAAP